MKVLFASFLFFVSLQNISIAQKTFISPGIKLGYRFGQDGGLTFGFEMSYIIWAKDELYKPIYGVVIGLDNFYGKNDFHFGVEVATPYFGVEVGPTISGRYDYDLGFSATIYTGLGLYPYYCYTYMKKNPNQHQIGSFFKGIIQTSGEKFSLGSPGG